MALRISGKSIDIGDAFRNHVEARVEDAVAKYFDGGFTGHVTLEREGSGFKTDCAIHLDTGILLRAEGTAQDPHQSFDLAAERIEKRLRRYKRRLKEHHHQRREDTLPVASYVIAVPDEDAEVAADYNPTIIAEETTSLAVMTVGQAVMAMDLADVPVMVFRLELGGGSVDRLRHAGHGGINVVYRRNDGHIGWVDPPYRKKEVSAH